VKAWEHFVALQETEIGAASVAKWLKTLKVQRFDACNLYLQAQDAFHAIWFEEHVRHKLQTHLFNNNGRRIKVHVNVPGKDEGKASSRAAKKVESKTADPAPFSLSFDELDPYCTLENVVACGGNELVVRLISELVGFDGGQYDKAKMMPSDFNPIYLYGASGLGKSHLLMAAAHGYKKQGMQVLYARAETFTEHVVKAIRAGEMRTFRQAYRSADVLLIDDAHLFSRKGATQEELFHTFNTLHTAGKQIILSAHCTPQELQYIEPRLVSRFEWGIVLPVDPMTELEMMQVIEKKAEALDLPLNNKVAKFLMETFSSGTASVVRALEALVLRSHMLKGQSSRVTLTSAMAENLLTDLIKEEQAHALTPEKIVQTTAEFYGIRGDDILSKSQSRECVLPRQIAMYLCRHKLKMAYMKIGDFFGRDHSTVMSGIRQVKKVFEKEDSDVPAAINVISKKLS